MLFRSETEMFLALLSERPEPARIPKNLLAGGTGNVHTDTKLTQGLEIPMAVSDARNAEDRIAVGVSVQRAIEIVGPRVKILWTLNPRSKMR